MISPSAHPQTFQLLNGCILLLPSSKQAPHSRASCAQLLAQADELVEGVFNEVGDRQQAQRVARGSCVKNDASEAGIFLALDKFNYLYGSVE